MQTETDYLVIGAGAMGMAFTDVVMTESDKHVVIVDKQDRPGGHWNHSYPFVRLHQPSSFYGVNSKDLGSDSIDVTGWNEGLYELASGTEVVTYFDTVMRRQFIPSGRVQYFPMCEYLGDGRIRSLVSGEEHSIVVREKTVDASYMNVTVPSMRKPPFEVADDITCVPLNELPRLHTRGVSFDNYVVIGAGKTGMDAVLWLLGNNVDPGDITWIMPRDSWMLDRKNIQPGIHTPATLTGAANQTKAIAESTSVDDMFERLHACGQLLRFDDNVKPTMYRCATVTEVELQHLRTVGNIVRNGRVQAITSSEIVLDNASLATSAATLHIDCSADGLATRPAEQVFNGNAMTLQTVRTCQQVFSAAFIAHVELTYADDAEKNDLCQVVPHPDTDFDFVRTAFQNGRNAARWAADPELQAWLQQSRLDGFSRSPEELALLSEEDQGRLVEMLTLTPQAQEKLQEYAEGQRT